MCDQLKLLQGQLSEERIIVDLNNEPDIQLCYQSLFQLTNNSVTNQIYLKQSVNMWAINSLLYHDAKLGELATFWLNWEIGIFQLKLNISVDNQCPVHCRSFGIYLTYREPIKYRTAVLYWELHLGDGWESMTVSQMPAPYTAWIVYVTQLTQSNICSDSTCSAQVHTSQHS